MTRARIAVAAVLVAFVAAVLVTSATRPTPAATPPATGTTTSEAPAAVSGVADPP